ncbi:hypothetical protein GLOTRDRAFT_133035 [Gloeophyllum trabeum ATCC 11539]|uniref:Uncharacterized protein n=1 Tax=Gloeophyllum trabeum (strain ATCC 11539 / FP-39264 / Madison 617) TaxID=670483 RepID=S7PVK6_GLOTA|nr:uncharacterized protein GLOTRDRAFT_133035 [Gloeophyllum trabeum ATCC 11539]EPQ51666.1 hypothetical protein GLOTRDRAFT_133035 [Gloeophyllum trabeum ATCC 11539]
MPLFTFSSAPSEVARRNATPDMIELLRATWRREGRQEVVAGEESYVPHELNHVEDPDVEQLQASQLQQSTNHSIPNFPKLPTPTTRNARYDWYQGDLGLEDYPSRHGDEVTLLTKSAPRWFSEGLARATASLTKAEKRSSLKEDATELGMMFTANESAWTTPFGSPQTTPQAEPSYTAAFAAGLFGCPPKAKAGITTVVQTTAPRPSNRFDRSKARTSGDDEKMASRHIGYPARIVLPSDVRRCTGLNTEHESPLQRRKPVLLGPSQLEVEGKGKLYYIFGRMKLEGSAVDIIGRDAE